MRILCHYFNVKVFKNVAAPPIFEVKRMPIKVKKQTAYFLPRQFIKIMYFQTAFTSL